MQDYIQELEKRAIAQGKFDLLPGKNISKIIPKEVPNEPGIYIIYPTLNCTGRPIYIGLAGSILRNDQGDIGWDGPGLRERLAEGFQSISIRMQEKYPAFAALMKDKKKKRLKRDQYFKEIINIEKYQALSFHWIQTHALKGKKHSRSFPAYIQLELLKQFYDENANLPELNNEFG